MLFTLDEDIVIPKWDNYNLTKEYIIILRELYARKETWTELRWENQFYENKNSHLDTLVIDSL